MEMEVGVTVDFVAPTGLSHIRMIKSIHSVKRGIILLTSVGVILSPFFLPPCPPFLPSLPPSCPRRQVLMFKCVWKTRKKEMKTSEISQSCLILPRREGCAH